MQYFGGKQRIAKDVCAFLNSQMTPGDHFYDLFCGAVNITCGIRSDVRRHANDLNSCLIALWKCVQNGWLPPREVTEEQYASCKAVNAETEEELALKAFIGFGCSFAGKWFKGFARSHNRNYALNAFKSCLKKKKFLSGVVFTNCSYSDVVIKKGSIIYCDIPYKGRTGYGAVGKFNYEMFYNWILIQSAIGNKVFVSEYASNVPEFCKVVFSKQSRRDIRGKAGRGIVTEVIYTPKLI